MTFSSSSQPGHWVVWFKWCSVLSFTIWKLILFFLMALHDGLPEVCSQLVSSVFKHSLSYMTQVLHASMQENSTPIKFPSSSKSVKGPERIINKQIILCLDMLQIQYTKYFTGIILLGSLSLKLKHCVKLPTLISTSFSVLSWNTEGIDILSDDSLYLTSFQSVAEIWFNFRIANLNWNDD